VQHVEQNWKQPAWKANPAAASAVAVAKTVEAVDVHVPDALGVAAATDLVDTVVGTRTAALVLVAAVLGHLEMVPSHRYDLPNMACIPGSMEVCQ
jgi:hypothetical protein